MEAYRDRHHVVFEKVAWSSRPEAKRIREHPSLIQRMDREDHNEIHRHCTIIPLLGYFGLQRTLANFEPGKDTLESMGNLMLAFEAAGNHPKAHPIDKKLAELSAWAVDLQRPFIADVLQRERRRLI